MSAWYSSALGSLQGLFTTAGKDYLNQHFSQRNAGATKPVYTTQSATQPTTQTVTPSATPASSGGGLSSSEMMMIGGGVLALAVVGYFMLRKG